jgi:single-strand DNA-binding protein
MSLNKVMLIGNLGADPEVRSLPSGGKVVNLNVATTDKWKDKQTGDTNEKTEWHRVVIYNEGLTRVAEQYLKKGSKVFLEGKLQTRKWEKDGQDHYSTEIVLQNFGASMELLGDPAGNRGDDRDGGRQDRGGGQSNHDRRADDTYERNRQQQTRAAPRSAPAFQDDDVPF